MNLQPVKSSAIAAIGHDEDTLDLHVKMTSGDTYCYSGVSCEVAGDFMGSTSYGRYYNNFIKGQYEGRKL